MGNLISSIRPSGGTQVVETQFTDLRNPSLSQLRDMMGEKFFMQSPAVGSQSTAILYSDEDCPDTMVELKRLGTDQNPPNGATTLDNVQTVRERTGSTIDASTDYVLTDPFSGCSYFMLSINGEDHAFHVFESAEVDDLSARLPRYHIVSEAIIENLPETKTLEDLKTIVDAYLVSHPNEDFVVSEDEEEYVKDGLALMVMENLEDVSGHAFTYEEYSRGQDYGAEQQDESVTRAYVGSAMLIRVSGSWTMLTQSALMEQSMINGERTFSDFRVDEVALNPPDLLGKLEELAGLQEDVPLEGVIDFI